MIIVVEQGNDLTGQLDNLVQDTVVQRVDTLAGARQILEDPSTNAEAVVIGPQVDIDSALKGARTLRQASPTINLVVVADEATPQVLREAMRSGVADVLERRPADAELLEAVNRARELTTELRATSAAGPTEPTSNRRAITVFSTKGGAGKSLLATNLAVLLAQEAPDEVVLVDLDLHSGDDAVMLQLLPNWTIGDAALRGAALDAEQLRGFLTVHTPTKLRLLAAPTHPAQADDIKPEDIGHILTLLRGMFRYVVIDGPAQFTDPLLTAVDHTDIVVVVAMMDVPSIKNLRMTSQTLQELGVPRDRLRLVLNRADSKVGLTVKEIESSLGTQIDAQVPSSREVPYAVNQGQPIVTERSKSGVSQAIRDLLDQVREPPKRSPRTEDEPRRFKLFGG